MRIVGKILKATKGIDAALGCACREIEILREYRARLIADVVTGKIDVREAAVGLPDEAEEPEVLDEVDSLINAEENEIDDLDTIPEEAEE